MRFFFKYMFSRFTNVVNDLKSLRRTYFDSDLVNKIIK